MKTWVAALSGIVKRTDSFEYTIPSSRQKKQLEGAISPNRLRLTYTLALIPFRVPNGKQETALLPGAEGTRMHYSMAT